ncbi:MAG: Calx-beta domain-containing protein [Steroidobacteraceae bacterium]
MTRRKKTKGSKSPLIRLVGLEAAAVAAAAAAGMTGSPAMAAPGDLDPSFGDVGRQSDIEVSYFSSLWSVDVQGDDSVLFGGGGDYDYYGSYEDYFVGRLLPNGAPDASFAAAALQATAVYDTALQSDGKVIGVGTARQPDGRRKLVVFRLRPDGSLDPDFGLGGLVIISDGGGSREAGYSVVIDPDGRIVVAGQRADSLLVARLLANGALDADFGSGGIYRGPDAIGSSVRIARAASGGYRVIASLTGGMGWDCSVIGLTAAGVPDAAFGIGGYATPQSSLFCSSLAVQPDGRILLGGVDGNASGYVGRLLANGAIDPAFDADVVRDRFKSVNALAVGAGGSVFVTGNDRTGFSGALVVRLLADGTLDTLFGRAGATSVDPTSRRASFPTINDMKVVDGERLVVGGNDNSSWPRSAFVARLLGNAGASSPGVLGMKQQRVLGTEQGGQAVLSVRRTGGSAGAVAVTYVTGDFPAPPSAGSEYAPGERATSGADYTVTTGRLTWADGDVGEREIVVPIASDTNAEKPEFFEVVLESPEGGAGLGAFGADVEIAGASYPVGDLTIAAGSSSVREGDLAGFYVSRNYYGQGAISVTVRVAVGGSATPGQDFRSPDSNADWQDVVLAWEDGETGGKYVPVFIVRDTLDEPAESFTLELVSPTGGAALGDTTQATVQINASSTPSSPPPAASGGSRGGGAVGGLGAMLLALGGALRRRRIWNR